MTAARRPWPTAGGPLAVALPPWLFYGAAVYTLLSTSGAIFGWASMSTVLASEGVFASQCSAGPPCKEQALALASVYTAASICSYAAPLPLGAFLDARGPRAAVLLCLALFSAGCAFIIAAAVSGTHALYYVGFVGLGCAASSSITPLYSVAILFPGREGLLLAVLNGSFDAGSLVFQLMAALHASGVALHTIWIAYACGPLAVSWLLAVLLWRADGFSSTTPPTTAAVVVAAPVCSPRDAACSAGVESGARAAPAPPGGVASSSASEAATVAVDGAAGKPLQAPPEAPPAAPSPPHPLLLDAGVDAPRLHRLPLARQLATLEFCCFAAAFCAWMLRFNFYIGSVHAQLEALGQAPGGAYTNLFGTVLPLGFFAQFAIGALIDARGSVAGLWALWALGVAFSAANLWLPLRAQPATFVLFAAFRGFLFTSMSAYCARVFGFKTLGRTIGLLVLLGGLVSLLQQALLAWAFAGVAADAAGDFARVNALLLALCAATAALPLWLTLRGAAARAAWRRRDWGGAGGAAGAVADGAHVPAPLASESAVPTSEARPAP